MEGSSARATPSSLPTLDEPRGPAPGRVLPAAFFARSAVAVAPDLLGASLCRRTGAGVLRVHVVETEAYEGPRDLASHASRGRTARNAPMFGPPGRFYVYLCYGVHRMLNVVTGPAGHPAAVLVRGVEGARGPGLVTRLLGVDRSFDGRPAARATGLWFEEGASRVPRSRVRRLPRVGVAYAGPTWAAKPWRFVRT